MPLNALSRQSQIVLAEASRTRGRLGDPQIGPEHLLIGLFADTGARSTQLLHGYGLTPDALVAHLQGVSRPDADTSGSQINIAARTTLAVANRIAVRRGLFELDVDSIALAICSHPEERLANLLRAFGLEPETVAAAISAAIGTDGDSAEPVRESAGTDTAVAAETGGPSSPGDTGVMAPKVPVPVGGGASTPPVGRALQAYGTDMVAIAAHNGYDKVVGRSRELDRVAVILCRRTKNNPVLIGEPGVGKSAVVEALAAQLATGNAPATLANRPLISLDLAAINAGARMRGDVEERVKAVVAEAATANAILFIDELHQVVGAGSGAGQIDVADMFKPSLARGEFSVIGATTLTEYRKYIEADAALERRFQPVKVGEPSQEEAVEILTGLAPAYAAHHRVRYTPESLEAAVRLSARYVTDRFLPDKAIDLLDEAGAAAGMRRMRTPAHIRGAYVRRIGLLDQIAAHNSAADTPNPAAAGTCTPGDLATQLAAVEDDLASYMAEHGDACVVDEAQMADLVSKATGVPVATMGDAAAERLRGLAGRLSARVVGQADAVDAVARAVRRARHGLGSPKRPASFIFAGPTGVGKTELAKALANDLFGEGAEGRGAFIELDMSEYGERASTARLLGAPPGYIGYGDGGQLTERVRRNPYAVLLLDEVEKAHRDVFDALLQVLEEGRLTDGEGRTVDFSQTTVIMTTNLGARPESRAGLGFTATDAASVAARAHAAVTTALKGHFRPEFLNRVDEVVVFSPLTRLDLELIVANLLDPVRDQLAERHVTLEVSDAATAALLASGYDKDLGARPLRRAITLGVADPVADALLAGLLPAGACARIETTSDGLLVCVPALGPAGGVAQGTPVAALAPAGTGL